VPFALIVPPKRDRTATVDVPLAAVDALPIAAPDEELLAVMFPLRIVRFTTVELPQKPYPLPMPERYADDEMLAVMFPSQS
jgi:hypothetical protein